MITARSQRRGAALGALVAAAAALFVTATPAPASAAGTRTINGTTSCAYGPGPYGFQVNLGSGWTSADSSYQLPGSWTKVWTKVIPSTATSVALDSFCYYNTAEYYGSVFYPYGTWNGYTYSLTPGTSTVNTTWSCARYPVSPGPWVRTCSLTAISYG